MRALTCVAIMLTAAALSVPFAPNAFAQAGSTGGTLGNTDKSISGERQEPSSQGSARRHKAIKPAPRADAPAKPTGGPKTFRDPRINGARVDWCMTPELGPGCGQSAANAWCTSKGFSRATSFNWIVQSAAFRQGDHTLCNGYCGAFTDVTCE
jgi:hypothetical protein